MAAHVCARAHTRAGRAGCRRCVRMRTHTDTHTHMRAHTHTRTHTCGARRAACAGAGMHARTHRAAPVRHLEWAHTRDTLLSIDALVAAAIDVVVIRGVAIVCH